MTDLSSSASAARRPPQRRGRIVFLAGCLLVFVLVAAGLHFLGQRLADPSSGHIHPEQMTGSHL